MISYDRLIDDFHSYFLMHSHSKIIGLLVCENCLMIIARVYSVQKIK